jgi:hypothetical protein
MKYKANNCDRMAVKSYMGGITERPVVTYFKLLFTDFSVEFDENYEKLSDTLFLTVVRTSFLSNMSQ